MSVVRDIDRARDRLEQGAASAVVPAGKLAIDGSDWRTLFALSSGVFLAMLTYFGAFLGQEWGLTTEQVEVVYMFGGIGYFLGGLVAGGPLGQLAPWTLLVVGYVALALIIGLVYSGALGTVGSAAMLPLAGFAGSLGWVALAAALTSETPAGAATTMTLNSSLFNLGAAGGGATGGLLLALAGYVALAVGAPLFGLASAVLAWWRS